MDEGGGGAIRTKSVVLRARFSRDRRRRSVLDVDDDDDDDVHVGRENRVCVAAETERRTGHELFSRNSVVHRRNRGVE